MPVRGAFSYLLLRRLTTAPGTPAAGGEHVYLKDSDGRAYRKDSAGVEAAIGGGPQTIYDHTCTGTEATLAIPFPATGTHATLRLLTTQPAGAGFGFAFGTQSTDNWNAIDPVGSFVGDTGWLLLLDLPWFRVALTALAIRVATDRDARFERLGSLNGQALTSFDVLCYAEGSGDTAPFPAGTLVQVQVD